VQCVGQSLLCKPYPSFLLRSCSEAKDRVEINGDILSYGSLEKYLASKWPRLIEEYHIDEPLKESFYLLSKENSLKFHLTYQYTVGEILRTFSRDYLLTPVFHPNQRSLKPLEDIVGLIQLHRKQYFLKTWQGPTQELAMDETVQESMESAS
jgi:hypothetical protein